MSARRHPPVRVLSVSTAAAAGSPTGNAALRLFRLAAWAGAVLVLFAGLLLAITIPIHAIDALSYGEWSRLIGQTRDFHFAGISAQEYHRPLFYVLQGWLWGVFGFHEWIGRVLSLAFSVVLVGSVAWLAARGPSWKTPAAVAALLVCLIPNVLQGIASGLTDVPLAALVALTAALTWGMPEGRARPAALALAGAATVLVKPTGLVALVALGAAVLVGESVDRRTELRRSLAPLAVGAGVALLYDAVQAHRLGMGLLSFLTAGSTGYYADLARSARTTELVGVQWLGSDLRPLVLFALAYTALRVVRRDHRAAVVAGSISAPAFGVVLPVLVNGSGIVGPFDTAGHGLAFVVLCASLPLAWWCPPEAIPKRVWLERFAVLGLVALAVWLWFGAYDTRLGSAAWPGLVALVAISFAPVIEGAAARFPIAVLAPGFVLIALLAYAYTDLDGLGEAQWKELRTLGVSGLFDGARTRNIVQPQISQVVALAGAEMGPTDRLASADGQLRYFFPGRVFQGYPADCAALREYRVFVLLTDEGTRAYMRDVAGVPDDPAYWAACKRPRLTQLSDGSGGYAVFRVER